MFKLWSAIKKDLRILRRDKVGLTLMLLMPVVLAIVIAAVQNNTFRIVNDNKVDLLICNKDSGEAGVMFINAIERLGMFEIIIAGGSMNESLIAERMHDKDALFAVIIPSEFSGNIHRRAQRIAGQALQELGMGEADSKDELLLNDHLTLMYHPVMQESFRHSVSGALHSALQIVETHEVIGCIYEAMDNTTTPTFAGDELLKEHTRIDEIPVSRGGLRTIPNATQHNIPAWTIFAMFFVVISLGSGIVREKLNKSFIRIKTLPTSYTVALWSKQITYLAVTLIQATIIFGIGILVFPMMGMPALELPKDIAGLFAVTLLSGWCAVSFALCVGVFSQSQEQANGFGAVSIVLLAAIGGLLVPSFAMPDVFQSVMKFSPLHWCLEAFYGLFLEGGNMSDIIKNILPLFVITIILQLITYAGLKIKNLI